MGRRVCVVLEECLFHGNMTNGVSQSESIRLVQRLKGDGDYIIVCYLNPEASPSAVEDALYQHNIPFDEVVHRNAGADLTITMNLQNPLFSQEDRPDDKKDATDLLSSKYGFIPSRSFNAVTVSSDNVVTKSSSKTPILGEMFFYYHMPADVAHFFPAVFNMSSMDSVSSSISSVSSSSSDDELPEHGRDIAPVDKCLQFSRQCQGPSVSIQMAHVKGPTFSHLLTARCLTTGRFHKVLASLLRLHRSAGIERACRCRKLSSSIYDNYARKLRGRMNQYREIYDEVSCILTVDHIATMQRHLRSYETEKRGHPVRVVHGDPVFCNIISERDGGIKFVDMRGMQGDNDFTLAGDALYDLSKCWLSTSGYDYIVRDRPARHREAEICRRLQVAFREHLTQSYPNARYRDVVLIASSLYASLLPLHESQAHRVLFARRAVTLLEVVNQSYARGEADLPCKLGVNELQYSSTGET